MIASQAKWSDFASMDGQKMAAAASQLLPGWVSLLLVVLIGWQLAQLAWMLVPAPAAGDAVATPPRIATTTDSGDASVNAISAAHIFGIANPTDEAPAPPPEEIEDLADTRLSNLSLKGTIAADPPETAVAIISDGGNKEQIYTIGSSVSNNAKLHAVYADRVVLDENGVLTNLKLPKEYPEGSPQVNRRDRTEVMRPTVSQESQSIQAVVAQNVSQLSDVIRPTPYFVDGQQQGYRVYPGRNRAQFTALGLRPGDLVKDIDGQALTDPTQAMEIFQTLGSASEVSVTVERNGQPEVIVLRTDQLDIADETEK